jgi:hypothetical protein
MSQNLGFSVLILFKRNKGSILEREPEKRLPHPRKRDGTEDDGMRNEGLRTSPVRRSLDHMCVHTFGRLSHRKVLAHSHFFGGHSQKS